MIPATSPRSWCGSLRTSPAPSPDRTSSRKNASITHYQPWTRNGTVTVPGGDRKWEPEEIGTAMNSVVFGSRHPGLWGVREFLGESAPAT